MAYSSPSIKKIDGFIKPVPPVSSGGIINGTMEPPFSRTCLQKLRFIKINIVVEKNNCYPTKATSVAPPPGPAVTASSTVNLIDIRAFPISDTVLLNIAIPSPSLRIISLF